jgi:hypothetical protein
MIGMEKKNEEAGLDRADLFVDIAAPGVGARIQRGVTGSNSRSRPALSLRERCPRPSSA